MKSLISVQKGQFDSILVNAAKYDFGAKKPVENNIVSQSVSSDHCATKKPNCSGREDSRAHLQSHGVSKTSDNLDV